MKTAVDWLVDHLYMVIPNEERNFLEGMRKEALEKEKEQIVFAHTNGHNDCYLYHFLKNSANEVGVRSGEEYYNQTYIQKEEQKQHIIDIMKADEDDGLYNQN